ncbi:MAG: hypothetical protein ACI8V0_003173, partial [Pseudohongiellaceae bacterium]
SIQEVNSQEIRAVCGPYSKSKKTANTVAVFLHSQGSI